MDLGFYDALAGMEWSRSYNSMHLDQVGATGPGWATAYSQRLEDFDRRKDLYLASGRRVTFIRHPGSTWPAPEEFRGELVDDGDGSWSVAFFDGTEWDFDGSGTLVSMTDWTGETVTLALKLAFAQVASPL